MVLTVIDVSYKNNNQQMQRLLVEINSYASRKEI